ncbi:hypothetical protein CALCODRAFT_442164, partial [Calocera cornea HHB12733]
YDYALTLPQEIAVVWSTPWTPGKGFFLLIRYLGFIDLPILLFGAWLDADIGTRPAEIQIKHSSMAYRNNRNAAFGFFLADAVIGLRTWAVWHHSVRCGCALVISYVLMIVATVYFKARLSQTLLGLNALSTAL